jgi:hypothetical protein
VLFYRNSPFGGGLRGRIFQRISDNLRYRLILSFTIVISSFFLSQKKEAKKCSFTILQRNLAALHSIAPATADKAHDLIRYQNGYMINCNFQNPKRLTFYSLCGLVLLENCGNSLRAFIII